jgi:hypothetical protein
MTVQKSLLLKSFLMKELQQNIACLSSLSHSDFFRGVSSLGRYVFGSEISYNKAPPRLPGLGC